jgi:1-deoxy-D-xylulose-5-phosphate synthase
MQLGKSEVLSWGQDGNILACGTMLPQAVAAADKLRSEGLNVGVVNARFVKPVDDSVIAKAAATGFVITIEENALMGGFGGAVLESANRQGLNTERFRILAIPDLFVEHGDRDELLAELGLDANGLIRAARDLCQVPASTDFRG